MATPTIRPEFLTFNDLGPMVEWFGFFAFAWNLPEHRPGIYLIIHRATGKIYLGISEDVFRRLRVHAKGNSTKKLGAAIKKHWNFAFLIFPLYYSVTDTDGLEIIEAALITEHDAINRGYNVIAAKGRVGPYGPAFVATVKAGITPERRKKRSQTHTLLCANDPDRLAPMRAGAAAALKDPVEIARKASQAANQWADPVMRARMIAGIKAAKALTREANSERVRLSWVGDDDRRARTAATFIKVLSDPEIQKKALETARLGRTRAAAKRKLKAGSAEHLVL